MISLRLVCILIWLILLRLKVVVGSRGSSVYGGCRLGYKGKKQSEDLNDADADEGLSGEIAEPLQPLQEGDADHGGEKELNEGGKREVIINRDEKVVPTNPTSQKAKSTTSMVVLMKKIEPEAAPKPLPTLASAFANDEPGLPEISDANTSKTLVDPREDVDKKRTRQSTSKANEGRQSRSNIKEDRRSMSKQKMNQQPPSGPRIDRYSQSSVDWQSEFSVDWQSHVKPEQDRAIQWEHAKVLPFQSTEFVTLKRPAPESSVKDASRSVTNVPDQVVVVVVDL